MCPPHEDANGAIQKDLAGGGGGWVVSSEGFSVRIEGKTGLRYKEEHGEPRIDSEAMAVPRMVVVVYTRTIPNSETRPQSQVLSNLQRAFLFVGWILSPQ